MPFITSVSEDRNQFMKRLEVSTSESDSSESFQQKHQDLLWPMIYSVLVNYSFILMGRYFNLVVYFVMWS